MAHRFSKRNKHRRRAVQGGKGTMTKADAVTEAINRIRNSTVDDINKFNLAFGNRQPGPTPEQLKYLQDIMNPATPDTMDIMKEVTNQLSKMTAEQKAAIPIYSEPGDRLPGTIAFIASLIYYETELRSNGVLTIPILESSTTTTPPDIFSLTSSIVALNKELQAAVAAEMSTLPRSPPVPKVGLFHFPASVIRAPTATRAPMAIRAPTTTLHKGPPVPKVDVFSFPASVIRAPTATRAPTTTRSAKMNAASIGKKPLVFRFPRSGSVEKTANAIRAPEIGKAIIAPEKVSL